MIGGEVMKMAGVIQKGVGQGAFFTKLDWVIEQFEKAMGAKPFPGTLNVRLYDEDIPKIEAFLPQKILRSPQKIPGIARHC